MDDRDRLARQLDVRIQLLDRRIVPGLDFGEEDLGERWAIDRQLAGLHAFEIHDRNDTAHHHGELDEASFVEILA
jgi:hypothetical protein